MSAVAVAVAEVELVDDAPFFAPVASDLIDGLLGQYQSMRRHIDTIAGIATGDMGGAIYYFIEGNCEHNRHSTPSVASLFDPKGAVAALNSAYWSKALDLTDVYEAMPKARRDEWSKSMREHTAPDFTEEAVRPTILELLNSREKFFAERVDGIFRGLSGDHVTNVPEAFGKRMIFGGMAEYGHYSYDRAGLINDLRCVIAKFMGRGDPNWNQTQALLTTARRATGDWHVADGGALRIRVYKKGTAHLEVHPDMAWRLNCVLAQMHPLAIPAEFRAKPKKRAKSFAMMGRPLPFAVLAILPVRDRTSGNIRFGYEAQKNKAAYAEAVRVIASIGGSVDSAGLCHFDYRPDDVLAELQLSGCVPDRMSHQFYPTPESVARRCIESADIGPTHTVLEPSAGQGDLAAFFPVAANATCVEVSALHCAVLRARGFGAVQADFIEWSATAPKFDRIVMNPPFSEGRAKAHVEAAAALMAPGGVLVAVMPSSARNAFSLAGWDCSWSPVLNNEFAGTSVSVAILTARPAA